MCVQTDRRTHRRRWPCSWRSSVNTQTLFPESQAHWFWGGVQASVFLKSSQEI